MGSLGACVGSAQLLTAPLFSSCEQQAKGAGAATGDPSSSGSSAPLLLLSRSSSSRASLSSSSLRLNSHPGSSQKLPSFVGLRRTPSLVGAAGGRGRGGRSQHTPESHLSRRALTGVVLAASGGGRQPWDFGRFLQTVLFFNEPPSLDKVVSGLMEKITGQGSSSSTSSSASKKGPGGAQKELVLVVGATGGVGKRVVDVLRSKGIPVRALVRNLEKAKQLLGPNTDVVTAELSQKATLRPEYFEGVTRVINCASVIVGPKEGDTAGRQKYYQGIKFYDPEVKGDTPEAVEYRGMQNLMAALRPHLGLRDGKPLFHFPGGSTTPAGPAWGALDDVVMGGVSQSGLQVDPSGGENGGPAGLFKGVVSEDNNGGFASIRTKNFEPVEDLAPYEGLELRVRGDGHRYKLIIRVTPAWDTVGYTTSFDTAAGGQWQSVKLPFSSFVPVFRARTVPDAPPFDTSSIASLQLMYSKFEYDGKLNPSFTPGPFELPLASIRAYLKDPITPRIVHVGSAGATRPGRPGLDLSKQPPAVRMNDELGGILTFKLKGEDVIRASGVPYTVVRPCALTEEPAGAELLFEQGDNITGKIGREEVARICVAALESPAAADKTFEVKSTVPFSTPFTVDAANPPPPRNYASDFESLQLGITGKEALEAISTVA